MSLARFAFGCVLFAAMVSAAIAETKAYKYVDEKGNVTYSQVPPSTGKDASKIDISPASGARSAVSSGYARPYPGSGVTYSHRPDHADALREQQRKREEARENHVRELEAQCIQARGTDCKNPQTLRYIESQNIPRTTVRAR